MAHGILCDVCQLRIPSHTINCDISAKRPGSDAARVMVRNLEVCVVCIDGEPFSHKKLTIKVIKIHRSEKIIDPITKV